MSDVSEIQKNDDNKVNFKISGSKETGIQINNYNINLLLLNLMICPFNNESKFLFICFLCSFSCWNFLEFWSVDR